ncbi:hypothetical protein EI42_03030 [Thermosporothrix hazakensis]|jgi:predicted RNA-binding Zn-ribbon protein involved in translation (DUF1610 family)|uniref:Zinc ribbon protein n=2 Tax=Thermosporothrix TaxID=768650 RepID=A0A326U772_THEHA|nr:hypothetical protein [Thermosporothrix hazakensis]PZW29308.1 hypothetical protein EI42_03030 [Thermosporothrix hazakensis]BBH86237.1 hypothetical protein KTC_09880 [Thermosporothrix sp. COM3]GCE45341.1 hypothetical protein KTH_02100 [Thermosporothrix hazakensis]
MKRLEERLPRRSRWIKAAIAFYTIGFICAATLIGVIIAPLFILIGGILHLLQFRYPVERVQCLNCQRTMKVEPEVQEFRCPYCFLTLTRVDSTWKALYVPEGALEAARAGQPLPSDQQRDHQA